jgi:hypothetical protein
MPKTFRHGPCIKPILGLLHGAQYRTTRNYKDGAFLGPRIGDKIFTGLLVMTLYLGVGNNFSPDNIYNIAAVLFMMCVLPSFGAAAYVPALVLGKTHHMRQTKVVNLIVDQLNRCRSHPP